MQRVVERLEGVSVDAAIYARRLEVFSAVLDAAGYEFVQPQGAFYLFPKSPLDDDCWSSAPFLQKQRILAVTQARGFWRAGQLSA